MSLEKIERVHRPTVRQFEEEYLQPGKPVILTGVMDDWRALSEWTRPYLAERVGSRRVAIRTEPTGDFSITPEDGPRYAREEMTFHEFLRNLDSPDCGRICYLQAECLEEKLPELLPDICIPIYADQKRLTGCRLWFGPGQRVALHYDMGHGLLAMIRGRKRLTMYDPGQLPFLYHSPMEGPNSSYPYSRVDVEKPDLGRFPEFGHARPVEVVLNKGEMLFLPAFWWHHVVSEGENVAVNFWWQLMTGQEIAALGRAFAAFHDAFRTLPAEWRAHVRRLANELVMPE
ncbi:MAG: cupin-like domain-containing protein [Acidobacteriota bacterium]|nr:cupin-like domain-containing protein [Acidobacteriota bacterium]